MKKIFTFCTLLFFVSQNANAKIWRVNNNTGVQADFTQASTAAASGSVNAGDTLYLESSATQYNGFSLTKKLIIIGTGYFLTDAANTKTQWNTSSAYIGSVNFNAGSAGSVLSGLKTDGIYLSDSLITIERCYITYYISFGNNPNSYADHDTLRQCFNPIYPLVSQTPTASAKGLMIYNNILADINFSSNMANTTAYVINNIFLGNNSQVSENCVFQNNIFEGANFGVYGASNYFSHNIFNNSSTNNNVAIGNNNQFSVTLTSVFAASNYNYSTPPTGFSHDGQFQLAASSPAINAGDINGVTVDCGAFGGPAPYVLSGMPHIPSIYSLTVPAQVNNGTASMNISLSSAAH